MSGEHPRGEGDSNGPVASRTVRCTALSVAAGVGELPGVTKGSW